MRKTPIFSHSSTYQDTTQQKNGKVYKKLKQKTECQTQQSPANTHTNPDMTVSYQKQLQTLVKGYALLPRTERLSLERTKGASPSVTVRFAWTQTPLHGAVVSIAGKTDQFRAQLVDWSNRDGSTRFPRQIGAALRSLGRHLEGKQRILAFFRALIRLKGVCMLDATPAHQHTPTATTTTTTTTTTTARRSPRRAAAFQLQHAWQRYRARRPPVEEEVADSWEDL